jgi:regulator of PEP synthase PpsR (kinase-PPPase family)
MTMDENINRLTPQTLAEAHEELARIRPGRQAPLAEWLSYYQRSAALYAEIAEIDRGHHHEALSMVERERNSAKEIAAQIRGGECGR